MNMLQLSPQISVCTPLGKRLAYLISDYGTSINTCWEVRRAGGQFKHFDASDVRLEGNPTYGFAAIPDIPENWKEVPVKKEAPILKIKKDFNDAG